MIYIAEKLEELRDNGQVEILYKYYNDVEGLIDKRTEELEELYKLHDFLKCLILECREEEY